MIDRRLFLTSAGASLILSCKGQDQTAAPVLNDNVKAFPENFIWGGFNERPSG